MANVLSSPDRINIKLSNGDIVDITIVDITQIYTLPHIWHNPNMFEYTGNFGYH